MLYSARRSMTTAAALALAAVATPSEPAPAGESQAFRPTTPTLIRPSPRYSMGMAYDSGRGALVLFGGWGSVPLGDTWEWNGRAWLLLANSGPEPRNAPALAYDAARERVVLFGGDRLGTHFGDTWEWDGAVWTMRSATGPAPRTLHRLAYDPAREKVLLFGGMDATTAFGDLWEWDGQDWTEIGHEGPARYMFGMAFDTSASRLVVFGGNTSTDYPPGIQSGTTWTWSGGAWDSLGSSDPGPRDHVAIAQDLARNRTVLYGGYHDGILSDLWELDGDVWVQRSFTGGPGPRSFPQLVYDARARVTLLYGGFDDSSIKNDLWSWDGNVWRRVDDEMVGTLLRRFDVEPDGDGLRIRFELHSDPAALTVERAPAESGPWSAVARLAVQSGPLEVLDPAAHPSASWWYRLRIEPETGASTILGSIHWPGTVAEELRVDPPAPNPTSLPLTVSFGVSRTTRVRAHLLDVHGRLIAKLVDASFPAGRHRLSWGEHQTLAAGIYFVRIETPRRTSVLRVVVVR